MGVGGTFFVGLDRARAARHRGLIAAALGGRSDLCIVAVARDCRALDVLDLPLGAIAIPAIMAAARLTTSLAPSLLIAARGARRSACSPCATTSVTAATDAVTRSRWSAVRPVAGGDRSRRNRTATMADPDGDVRAWRRPSRYWVGALAAAGGDRLGERDAPAASGPAVGFRRLAVPVVAVLLLTGLTLAVDRAREYRRAGGNLDTGRYCR